MKHTDRDMIWSIFSYCKFSCDDVCATYLQLMVTERGCDQVIGNRQKKKGMSWGKQGSRSLGILKVMELNNKWNEIWFPEKATNSETNRSFQLPLAANM